MSNDPARDAARHADQEQQRARRDEERAKDQRAAQRDYAPGHTPHEQPVDPHLRDG